MYFTRTFLTIILLTWVARFSLFGQAVDKQFSKAELQTDFQVWRNKYEDGLANLYLYSTKQQLDEHFDSLYLHLEPMTAQQFYSYITPISRMIKDGHSNILPSQATTTYYDQQAKFFPFHIYWTADKMFIAKNFSADTTLHAGTEILSINGVSAGEVLTFLLARQVRDGYNENYARWILNQFFREYYSYHFGHPKYYILTVNSTAHLIQEIRVAALSKESIASNKAARYAPQKEEKHSYFQVDSVNNTGIFTIKTWDDKKLKKKIDFVFSQLQAQNIKHLILDVRDNQGGNTTPAIYLLSHLLQQPFQYFNDLKSVAGHTRTSQLLKRRHGKMLGTHPVIENPFQGPLYVLTNGGSFSNTGSFCARIEFYKRGIFIGEETGGNKVVLSGVFGLKKNTVLPHTKIICENANYQMTVTDIQENTGHGVLPAYPVTPTIDDVIQNKDAVLNAALELIKSNKNQ